MSERNTEWLFLKEAGIELGENDFGYVFAQGKATSYDDISDLLRKMGGKPDICDLEDYSTIGTGMASPEYLVTFNNDKNTLLLVECKGNEKQHESKDRNRPKAFSVDGGLWYAKHLKNNYNVIVVAISGKSKDRCRVSVFNWFKGHDNPIEAKKLSDSLSHPSIYLKYLLGEDVRREFDIKKIRELALVMHDKLRENKVSVKDRPIFIASILIALRNDNFRAGWERIPNLPLLVNSLTGSIEDVLNASDIKTGKKSDIVSAFKRIIRLNEKLKSIPSGASGSLAWFIGQLDGKIYPMMNYDYTEDALGIFYHEFTKYSSSDGNGLGIVLTPKHLTEFMCEVGEINKNSKVLDICCGSASFLVTAMSKMCKESNQDEIDSIKRSSLFGIEFDFELYTLAVANMIIRRDGKSNLIHGDCFKIKDAEYAV